MCTRYISPEQREIEAFWKIDRRSNQRKDWDFRCRWPAQGLGFPLSLASFIRRADEVEYARELVIGQWGMIPPWSTSNIPASKPRKGELKGKRLSTVNARTDRMEKSPTYKSAWARGKRCIIPAASFDEPNWESEKNEWWRFRRADGKPWGVAGLWDSWTDLKTGEIWDSYTMLTINANLHPLMSRMRKIERDRESKQVIFDKRSVVPLEEHDFDRWLTCTVDEARDMLLLPSVNVIDAGPAPSTEQTVSEEVDLV